MNMDQSRDPLLANTKEKHQIFKIVKKVVIIGSIVAIAMMFALLWQQLKTKSMNHEHLRFSQESNRLSSVNCTTFYFDQYVDHFTWGSKEVATLTYKQRYLMYDKHWDKEKGPIFFYCGNEGDVTLYANHTGLMWENAEKFKALLIFAEHRYYGESKVLNNDNMKYLSHEQALADYATLITSLKTSLGANSSSVIAFGGSYGGMLAAWFRMKYPDIIDGAIASSAPILMFEGQHPAYNKESYWQVVSRDATTFGGSNEFCAGNVQKTWNILFDLFKSHSGRKQLSSIFQLCTPLQPSHDVEDFALYIMMAFDTMAMGNFPYPSNYLTNSPHELPAWPMKVACSFLSKEFKNEIELLHGISKAIGVFYNASQSEICYSIPPLDIGLWDYQWCSEMLPQETYFETDGVHDMFWKRKIDPDDVNKHCNSTWGVEPRPNWITINYGGYDALRFTSNIVFTNGLLDPWSSGGVLTSPSDTVISLNITQGAHHLDLFFSHPNDPDEVVQVRKIQTDAIEAWISESSGRNPCAFYVGTIVLVGTYLSHVIHF